jgi:predicted transcriptional regulator
VSVVSLRLPDEVDERLAREAKLANTARAEIARRAIVEYLDRQERERLVATLVAEARAGYGDPDVRREALAAADEFALAESEALDNAEGKDRASRRSRPVKRALRRR